MPSLTANDWTSRVTEALEKAAERMAAACEGAAQKQAGAAEKAQQAAEKYAERQQKDAEKLGRELLKQAEKQAGAVEKAAQKQIQAAERQAKAAERAAQKQVEAAERQSRAGSRANAPQSPGGLKQQGNQKLLDGLNKLFGGKGQAAGSLAGKGGMGGMGAAGVAGIAFAATHEIFKFLGTVVAPIMEVANNKSLTSAQSGRMIAEKLPVVGDMAKWWHDFQDALHEVNEKIRRTEVQFAANALRQSQAQEKAMTIQPIQAEARNQQLRGIWMGRHADSIKAAPAVDRSTFQGDIQHMEQQALLPLKDAEARAKAELQTAHAQRTASSMRLTQLTKNRGFLQFKADKAREKEQQIIREENIFGGMGNPFGGGLEGRQKAERQQAGREAQLAEQAVLNNEAQIQAEIERQKELGVQAAEKESAVRKAGIAIQKEELALLQQKEQRLTQQTQRLGRMNVIERQLALQAAKQAKEKGIETLLPQQKALLEQVAPQFAAKEYEKLGEKQPEYQELQKMGVLEEGSLKEVREQIQNVQTQVRIEVALDESKLAKEIAEVLSKSVKQLIDSLDAKFKAQMQQQKTGQQLKNNQQG